MAQARLVKSGTSSFKKEQQERVRKRRELDKARIEARKIRRAGGSAQAQLIGGKAVVITVKEAPKVATLQTKSGKPIRQLTQFDVQRIRNLERQRQVQIVQKQEEAKKRTQLRFTDTGRPETTKVLTAISKARSDVTVPIPRKKLEGVVAEEFIELRKNADPETFIRLKKFGISNKVALAEAKKAFNKKERAIKKVEAVNTIIENNRKGYQRSVNFAIDTLVKVLPERSPFKKQIQKSDFFDRTVKLTTAKITSFLNPLIVGTEIGAFGDNFKTLREAGIIQPAKFVDKTFTSAGKGIKFVLTNNPKTTFKIVNDKTVDFAVKTIEGAKKNLNPKTPEGLSNLLTIAVFVRPDKILKGVGQKTIKNIKKVANNPRVRRVTKNVALSPLAPVVGAGRGKGVKIKGKPLSKAAKKQAARGIVKKESKKLTKAAVKRQRKELRSEQSFQNVAQRQSEIDFTAPVKSFTVSKGKKIVLKRGKTVIGTVKVQPTARTTAPTNVQISRSAKSIEKVVSQGGKAFSSGNLKLITKQQRQGFKAQGTTALKKSGASAKTKQVVKKNLDRRVPKTADTVNKDLTPQALYPQLIEVGQQGRGGFRKGVKENLLKKLEAQKKALQVQQNKEVAKTNLLINNVVKKKYKDVRERNLVKSLIYNEVFRPKFNVEVVGRLVDKGFASRLDNTLRALSLLNFKFDVTTEIIKIVKRTPVIKPKTDVAIKPKTRITKKVVSKPIKKTSVKKGKKTKPKKKVSQIVKERAKKKLLIRKILKSPRIPIPRIRIKLRLPKRLFLPKIRKNKRIRKTIDVIRASIPSQFRPTLEAIYFEILDTDEPTKITGLEVRAIILKLAKKRGLKNGKFIRNKKKISTKTTRKRKKTTKTRRR